MSSNFALRSHGEPYFTLVQNNLHGMGATSDIFNNHDVVGGYITLEVHALPVQLADPDEYHKVWSLHEYPVLSGFTWVGTEFLWIAVTPSGRLAAGAVNGAVAQTAPGTMAPNGGLRTYLAIYVGATGLLVLKELLPKEGGFQPSSTLASATGAPLTPAVIPGRHARMTLFNGYGSLTRMPCSIRRAEHYSGFGVIWPFAEGRGRRVVSDPYPQSSAPYPGVERDFRLDAGVTTMVLGSVFAPPPYPTAAGIDLETYYRWELRTEYERDDPSTPTYIRAHQ